MDSVDALVVGAGPAGLTAAIYLRRYGRSVCLADTGASRARWIDRSHNVPGFPAGLSGAELLARLTSQLAAAEGEVTAAEVTRLVPWPTTGDDPVAAGFAADVGGRPLAARTVLLACGVVDRMPPVEGLAALREEGWVRQCPICDGPEHRDERIGVIGDGEHAAREADFLRGFSEHVSRFAPRELRRAERALPGPLALHLADGTRVDCDVLYAACGVTPRNALATQLGAPCDAAGGVQVDARCATGVPRLWAAGDLVSALDQIAVALGHGAIAATAMHNALRQVDPPG